MGDHDPEALILERRKLEVSNEHYIKRGILINSSLEYFTPPGLLPLKINNRTCLLFFSHCSFLDMIMLNQ